MQRQVLPMGCSITPIVVQSRQADLRGFWKSVSSKDPGKYATRHLPPLQPGPFFFLNPLQKCPNMTFLRRGGGSVLSAIEGHP